MAEIVQAPQLRYTPGENQIAVAEMLVQFPGLRTEDPPATLKVVGWGNLAQEIQERCHQGDRILIEGRLNMNTIDRPEGFKEKRAELTAQRLHYLGAIPEGMDSGIADSPSREPAISPQPSARPTNYSTPAPAVATPAVATSRQATEPMPQPAKTQRSSAPMPAHEADVDDIPF